MPLVSIQQVHDRNIDFCKRVTAQVARIIKRNRFEVQLHFFYPIHNYVLQFFFAPIFPKRASKNEVVKEKIVSYKRPTGYAEML